MKTITLSKDHAFVRYFTVDCRKVREKVWRVRWRDFSTQKQDAEFENARRCPLAGPLRRQPHHRGCLHQV